MTGRIPDRARIRSEFSINPRLARLGVRSGHRARFLPPAAPSAHSILRRSRTGPARSAVVPGGVAFVARILPHPRRRRPPALPALPGDPLPALRTLVADRDRVYRRTLDTLIASAYDLGPDALWFPPLVETLIAVSIVYMALENIVGAATCGGAGSRPRVRPDPRLRLSFALARTCSSPAPTCSRRSYRSTSASSSANCSCSSFLPALQFLFRHGGRRAGRHRRSVGPGHPHGWHWMMERADRLLQFQFQWPALTTALLASVLRWLMLVVALAGLLWFVSLLRQRNQRRSEGEVAPTE